MAEPRIPEVGSSPLLNRKVIDKPISDPIFNQQTQMAPPAEPQFQQPAQPQIPGGLAGDASTEHLTPPQAPIDDPNLRSMSFDDFGAEDTDESGTGGSGADGGSQQMQLPKGEAREFAKVIVKVGSMYIPVFLSKLAKINVNELKIAESQGVVPPGAVQLFTEINNNTEAALQLTEDEQKLLLDALKAYLEWKSIEAANPGTGLAIALGAIGLRLGLTTVQLMAENKRMYREFLQTYATPAGGNTKVNAEPTKTEG